jgi:hypothetical protein
MAKLPVGMEPERMEALRRTAAEAGASMAEIVRRALRAYLQGLPEDLPGIGPSGSSAGTPGMPPTWPSVMTGT